MALITEDLFGHYSLDTGDPAMINSKENGFNQENLSTNTADSKHLSYNTLLSEKAVVPNTEDKTSEKNYHEQLESSDLELSALSTSNVSCNKAKFFLGAEDNEDDASGLLYNEDESEEFDSKPSDKIKRVHFNQEVETYMFEPGLSITENYHFTEEFTVRNAFANANCERKSLPGRISRVLWKSESNLAVRNLKPCSQCGFMEEFSRYDRHIRQPKKELSPIIKYSRFDDEVTSKAPKNELKGWQRLKRTCSFIRKPRHEDGTPSNVSGNLNRRSKSMLSLKNEAQSFMDKVLSKVTNKKGELDPIPESSEVDTKFTTKVSSKYELNDTSIFKRTRSFFFRTTQEDGNEFKGAGLRSSKSTQALKRTDSIFMPDLTKIDAGDIPFVSDELKTSLKQKRIKNLPKKENSEDKNGISGAGTCNFGLRMSKSVYNFKDIFDTKFLRDKFVKKK